MNSRKNRFISGFLSFAMVFTLVIQALPPIEVSAAGGGITLNVPYDKWEGNTGYIDIEVLKPNTFSIQWSTCPDAECYKLAIRNLDTDDLVDDYDNIIIDKDEYLVTTSNGKQNYNYTLNSSAFDYSTSYRIYVGAYASESDSSAMGDYWNTAEFTVCDKLYIEPAEDEITVNSDKQSIDISVNSNITTWYISEDVDWIYVDPKSGNYDDEFTINISANSSTTKTRTAEIKLYYGTYVVEYITVNQEVKSTLTLSPESLDFGYEAGEELWLYVTANEDWEITDYPSWVSCSIDSYSVSSGTVKKGVRVTTTSDNTTGLKKTGYITVETNSREEEIEVTQESDSIVEIITPTISLDVPTKITLGEAITWSGTVDGNGDTIEIVTVGIQSPNTAVIYFRNPNLNHTTYDISNIYNGTLPTGTDIINSDGTDVTGSQKLELDMSVTGEYSVTVYAKTTSMIENEIEPVMLTKKIVVTKPNDSISINPDWNKVTSPATGGIGTTFTVTSSGVWYVETDVSWISFNRESGESGTSFTPTIASNANEYREGIITVTCGDASIGICVQQEGTTTEPEEVPCVTSLSVNPTEGTLNTTYTFTAKAENTDTVAFYVSGYKIGEVTSTTGTFECTYNKFTSGGDRVIYAYPCDEYGNEIKTGGSYLTEKFTITVDGTLSPVKISTDSYQTIDVNTSFTVEWADTAAVPNDVSYNIYVWYDNEQVADIINTSSHSKTIPSSYFTKEGRYIIGIYAISDTWAASSGVSIVVNATVDVPYIENFAISPNTVSLGGSAKLSGMVYGNGSDIAEIIIKITNNSDGTGGVYETLYPNGYKLDMADTPGINTSDAIFTTPGTYSVKLYALNEGAVNEVLLGQKTLQVVADSKITLNTPVLGGASTISYGDDYTVSWNYDGSVDYYLIGISGLTYSKTVDASNSSYTIPFSVFKQYLGSSGSNFTVYVTAMSNSDTYLPSAKESKNVYVSGNASEKAVIKSVTLPGRDHNEVTAGETVTFEVVTSTDVEAIRMKDGAGTFIVNTWNSGYTDSGSNRTWTVKQKVSYAGSSDVDYVNRSLTFYSMIGNTEYNKCNVTFICVKDAVVGAFDITKPVNGSEQHPEKSLTITWTTPDTGVDYYVVDITHNGVRIDEDVFPYEVRNGNSYTLDGSYLIRDNNAWNVQVTGCKAGMADTSDSVRFVLKCQHEKLGTAVEKYLSYTNTGSSSTHSVKTEKTYPCLECGMTNAKTETGTKAVNHNYITLDEGGKVCNQCWYVNSNGSYDVQYDMSLVTTNSNGRENVYANVGADGNPVNVQSNRYVEVGDSITVWGVLGNSYLIEYPTSSGTHKGFIKNTKTSKPTYNPSPSVDLSGLCSEEIINAVDAFFDVHKWSEEDEANNKYVGVGVLSPEYALARDILMNETPDNNWFAAFLTYLGKDQFDNVWSFVQGNEALEKEEIKAAIYLVLENVIYDDVDNFEMAEAAETIDDIASQVGGIKDTIKRGKQAYELTTEIIYQTNPELANKFTQLYLDIMNTDKYPTNAPISKLILDLQNQKALDATIKYSVLALKIIADTMEIAYIRNRTSVETIALLKEAFGNISTGTADDLRYKQMLLDVLEEIELELNSNIWSTAVSIMDVLGDHIAKNTIKNIAKETLKAVGKTAVFSAVTVYDLLRSAVLSFSGLDDYINACNESYALLPIGGVIDSLYLDYVIKYKQQGFTEEEYFKFYCLHNIEQGVQISYNEIAIKMTNSLYAQEQLQKEITHLETNTLKYWRYNPYTTNGIELPDFEWIYNSTNTILYKKLLTNWVDEDSLGPEMWYDCNANDRYIVANEIQKLKSFSEASIDRVYVIRSKVFDTVDSIYDDYSLLFQNTNKEGLLVELCWQDNAANMYYYITYTVLTSEEVEDIIGENGNYSNKIPSNNIRISNLPIRRYKNEINFNTDWYIDYSCLVGKITKTEYVIESLMIPIDSDDVKVIADICIEEDSWITKDNWMWKSICKAIGEMFDIRITEYDLKLIRERMNYGLYKKYKWHGIV